MVSRTAVTALLHERGRERGAAMPAHDQQFRDELRSWLIEHPPPDVDIAGTREEAEVLREWQRTLHAARWVGIHWPVEDGGRRVLGLPASRAASIMGGTNEIQRNVIGERLLGLPREPRTR